MRGSSSEGTGRERHRRPLDDGFRPDRTHADALDRTVAEEAGRARRLAADREALASVRRRANGAGRAPERHGRRPDGRREMERTRIRPERDAGPREERDQLPEARPADEIAHATVAGPHG